MKELTIFMQLLIISIALFSCERNDDNGNPESSDYYFKAYFDGKAWSATDSWNYMHWGINQFSINGLTNKSNSYYVSSATDDTLYYSEKELRISVLQENIITGQKITDFNASIGLMISDAGYYFYKTEAAEDSYLIVNTLDIVNNTANGEFKIELSNFSGETIKVTDGEFNISFENLALNN